MHPLPTTLDTSELAAIQALIQENMDSERCYTAAANCFRTSVIGEADQTLADVFASSADLRRAFAALLRQFAIDAGAAATDLETAAAMAEKLWDDFEAARHDANPSQRLSDLDAVESRLLTSYQEALEVVEAGELREVLTRQRDVVEAAREMIVGMRANR